MKALLFFACLFICLTSFAQTPTKVEADLLKSYNRISHFFEQQSHDTTGRWGDSLFKANSAFAIKLKNYTEMYPSTITQNFSLLKKEYLDVSTSEDGLLRIYSWDTNTGGTLHFFESVFLI